MYRHILVLALIVATLNLASLGQTTVPTGPTAAELERLVTEFVAPNGMKVLVKRRPGSQTVVADLFLKGGSQNVTANNAGIEALMLDAATESTQKYPLVQLRRELSRTGSNLSYGMNDDYSVLSLASTRRFFDRSWEVFVDSVVNPSFTPDDFKRVKDRQVASLSGEEDTPDSFLQVLQRRVVFAGHPYLNDPRGTLASMSKLTLDDVKRFRDQMMQGTRLLLVVVGDVDAQDIRAKVDLSLGKLPKGDYRSVQVPSPSFAAPSVSVTARQFPTNYITGIYSAPSLTSADLYPMRVASSILQNRVFIEVRVKRNLSYAPDAFLGSEAANTGGIYVTAVDANQAIRVMRDEITRLQTQEISPEEIATTAQQFLTRYYLGQETNAAQAGELAQYEIIGGGWRNSAVMMDRLRAVTPADVARVANKYMRNLQFVVIGSPQAIDRSVFVGP
ncbi:MAG TPA: pitrilysin family protein [Pyrinomonadaceae bacterium]|jgi:predicted Zn-dependent peptidase